MQIEDHGPEATIGRLANTLELCFHALSEGIALAEEVHAQNGWDSRADPQMFSHLVRREALDIIKGQNPEARDEDNLGAAMSGLHLTIGETDQLRIWHGSGGEVRVPSTETGRSFLKQASSSALYVPIFGVPEMPSECHTILLWEHKNGTLSRFTLIRPLDAESGHVVADWREPLLLRFSHHVEDLAYRPRPAVGRKELQGS
ncbi:hypothetical protein ACO03V_05945 [Microbacterium sp. HMH0099]|uniref:hypothetical protein n=1 Tax=Microbacterium sp. HMH0099 TaxID=3414026 RepID=UPI003BF641D0